MKAMMLSIYMLTVSISVVACANNNPTSENHANTAMKETTKSNRFLSQRPETDKLIRDVYEASNEEEFWSRVGPMAQHLGCISFAIRFGNTYPITGGFDIRERDNKWYLVKNNSSYEKLLPGSPFAWVIGEGGVIDSIDPNDRALASIIRLDDKRILVHIYKEDKTSIFILE